MTKSVTLAVSLLSVSASMAFAGFGSGGGSPPALDTLEQLLMSQQNETAGLFTSELGDIGLGVKSNLEPEMIASKNALSPRTLKLSESDFDLMSKSVGTNIDTISLGQGALERSANSSFKIEDGQQLGELVLKDRRIAARNSVK